MTLNKNRPQRHFKSHFFTNDLHELRWCFFFWFLSYSTCDGWSFLYPFFSHHFPPGKNRRVAQSWWISNVSLQKALQAHEGIGPRMRVPRVGLHALDFLVVGDQMVSNIIYVHPYLASWSHQLVWRLKNRTFGRLNSQGSEVVVGCHRGYFVTKVVWGAGAFAKMIYCMISESVRFRNLKYSGLRKWGTYNTLLTVSYYIYI